MEKFSNIQIIIETEKDRKEGLVPFPDIKQKVIPAAQITKVLISEKITAQGKTGIQLLGKTQSGEWINVVTSGTILKGIYHAMKGAAERFGQYDL